MFISIFKITHITKTSQQINKDLSKM